MSDNLVDTMMEEMSRNNSPDVLAYQPHMSQPSPIQAQSHPQMGEIQYVPPDMDVTRGMPPQYPMQQPIAGQPPMQMAPQQQMPQQPMMIGEEEEAPNFNSYGMEEEDSMSLFGLKFGDFKDPLIVIALAIILSLPQIQRPIRNLLARFVQNPLYLNILQAVVLGVVFYLVRMLI